MKSCGLDTVEDIEMILVMCWRKENFLGLELRPAEALLLFLVGVQLVPAFHRCTMIINNIQASQKSNDRKYKASTKVSKSLLYGMVL